LSKAVSDRLGAISGGKRFAFSRFPLRLRYFDGLFHRLEGINLAGLHARLALHFKVRLTGFSVRGNGSGEKADYYNYCFQYFLTG
jgi:hypothetical protein